VRKLTWIFGSVRRDVARLYTKCRKVIDEKQGAIICMVQSRSMYHGAINRPTDTLIACAKQVLKTYEVHLEIEMRQRYIAKSLSRLTKIEVLKRKEDRAKSRAVLAEARNSSACNRPPNVVSSMP
jgi:hypothetical protein